MRDRYKRVLLYMKIEKKNCKDHITDFEQTLHKALFKFVKMHVILLRKGK